MRPEAGNEAVGPPASGLLARAARRLGEAPFRRWFGPLVVVVSIAAQAALYEGGLRPFPTIGSAFAVSTALGLVNGRGLTVTDDEAMTVRAGVDRWQDLLPLYRGDAPRGTAHEPLPGVSLLFATVALATGSLRLGVIVYLQMALHALGAWLLSAELKYRSGFVAACTAVGWALFVPEFRSTLMPGYDSLPAVIYVAVVFALLRAARTESLAWLGAAGIACGVGLWTRDYLILLPSALVPAILWLRRPRLVSAALFAVPVALFALGLSVARSPASGATHRMIRGGVWHTFWAGVGQFENPYGLDAEDHDVRDFASRLAPAEDFSKPNYQYLPAYDHTLAEAGRTHLREHWPSLIRNTAYRLLWLVFPSFTPSKEFAAGAKRWLLVLGGVPISLLSLVGLWVVWRRDRFEACVLAAPIFSLAPLALYYVVAKVPACAFFTQLAFAAFALDRWLLRRGA